MRSPRGGGALQHGALAEERQRLHGHVLRAGVALGTDHRDDAVDLVRLDAGEDGGVALAQEAAGAAHLRGGIPLFDELSRELLRVGVRRDDDDELQLTVFQVFVQ
jgi:hypothetical protein